MISKKQPKDSSISSKIKKSYRTTIHFFFFSLAYKYYYLLLFLFLAIRIVPISVGNSVIDDALNDITVGAFASVLVALLIALHDDWKNEQSNRIIYSRLVLPFYSALAQYLEMYCMLCGFIKIESRNEIGTFEYWFKRYEELSVVTEDLSIEIEEIKEKLDEIQRTAQELENQEIILLKLDIITKEQFDEISDVATKAFMIDAFFTENENFIHNITVTNTHLNRFLKASPTFRPLTEQKYGYDFHSLSSMINSIQTFSKG